ncbi:MAG: hypothetical protein KKE11_04265 [Gammaproteobacteria bacterium]|nr:hypothetical protein [Gammaproteobacteria bacterium]
MNNIADNSSFDSQDEISLYDIWNKLVQYKKVFWVTFLVVFLIGVGVVLNTPKKYTFTEVLEVGRYVDDRGQYIKAIDVNTAVAKIKKVLFSQAIDAYNLQTGQKINKEGEKIIVDIGGAVGGGRIDNSILSLSIIGQLSKTEGYKFIFQQIVDELINEGKYIDLRIKSLSDFKADLEGRMATTKAAVAAIGPEDNTKILRDKIREIKTGNGERLVILGDSDDPDDKMIRLQGNINGLQNNINTLQMQIDGTYNTKVISEFTVSNHPIGASRVVLSFFVAILSLIFAFFCVFVVDFIIKLKNYQS